MTLRTRATKSNKHVSPLFVLMMGLLCGVVAAWMVGAVTSLGGIIAYGLFGMELDPPSGRVFAFAFSAVFVTVTLLGWASWVLDALNPRRSQ